MWYSERVWELLTRKMEIVDASSEGEAVWNRFVREHYPPVGSFMLAWEWGVFQRSLGRKVDRYFLKEKKDPIAAFTFVRHRIPFGFSYGYSPRGPLVAAHAEEGTALRVFKAIQKWGEKQNPNLIFVRLEPPFASLGPEVEREGFHFPRYYVQPRYNQTVLLDGAEEDIVSRFHPSTRSNLKRAERRGVTVEMTSAPTSSDYHEFFAMTRETMARNRAKNVYPSRGYFDALVRSTLPIGEKHNPCRLTLGIFSGCHEGVPAAIHFVLFFGDTATYLYGAAYTEHLSSKVTTYLHWMAMREAKRRGLRYYDIGGVDEKRWPTLTAFKRQFGGREFTYVGNVDIPSRPNLYHIYNFFRGLRRG